MAAKAAERGNELSRQAYITDQRPWITVGVEIGGPLTWRTVGGEMTGNVFCDVCLENTGRSPGFDVSIHAEAVVRMDDRSLVEDQLKLANRVRKDGPYLGNSLFPGQKFPGTIHVIISADDLKRGLERWKDVHPGRDWIELFVVGTIDYRDELVRHGDGSAGEGHQTGFIVRIVRHVPEGNLYEIGPSLGDIKADHLDVRRWYHDGRVD